MATLTAAPDGSRAGHGLMSAGERLAAACLAVAIVAGSALVWIGVPVGGIWVAGRVTGDGIAALLLALVAIPAAMTAVGWLLGQASARYEELRGRPADQPGPPSWRASLSEDRAGNRRARRPRRLLDAAMTISASTALVLLVIWFFFFAEFRLSPFP
jgi:hypothetical protein